LVFWRAGDEPPRLLSFDQEMRAAAKSVGIDPHLPD